MQNEDTVDEISHRRGHRYLTVVVCHDTGRLVWAAAGPRPGRPSSASSTHSEPSAASRSSSSHATWRPGSPRPIAERLPNAVRCVDPFHVVQLATDALDQVRREVWNEARRAGQRQLARDLKGARFALWKNPENLTTRQQTRLREIEQTNKPLYQAYLLKEHLRQIYRLPTDHALNLLAAWLEWARDSRLDAVPQARATRSPSSAPASRPRSATGSPTRASKRSTPRSACSPAARSASTAPTALIALAMLSLADLCPPLPR